MSVLSMAEVEGKAPHEQQQCTLSLCKQLHVKDTLENAKTYLGLGPTAEQNNPEEPY